MKVGRETETHLFDVEHVGVDIDFYHPKGRDLALAPDVVASFLQAREDAEIFIQNSSATQFSSDEILNWYLLQSQTTLAAHLPQEALDKDHGAVLLTLPIRFAPDTFHMLTEDGNVDLKALKVMCKVTITRRNG